MRVIVLALCACILGSTASADTVWSIEVPARDGGKTKLRSIDGNPNEVLRARRCVSGMWRLAKSGESETHFVGTIDAPSFNHPRKKTRAIIAKVRKTRAVMGVHRDFRPALHGILRGKGQLVLEEVAGGEWEVVGFTDEPAGDLFAHQPGWRVDAKHPPGPAKPSPLIDAKADASSLADLINDYRATLGLPRIRVSPALTKVAQAHVHDLNANKPVTDRCNMHSWSDKGEWSSCCYDGGKAAARCMWKKPKEIAGYPGNGYEIAANASGITPAGALELWQNSPAHHVVMINKNQWTKPWRSIGVAVEGDYAVAWFGEEADK